jgi:hypothetical protein
MINMTEWMKENKVASNDIQAANIFAGLELGKLDDAEAMKARVILYRKWRPKTDKKNQLPTYQAFQLAIAGIDPDSVEERQIEMELPKRTMKYSDVPEGAIFYIEGTYSYPKRKIGSGHVDIRDGCSNSYGNPDWDVELEIRTEAEIMQELGYRD